MMKKLHFALLGFLMIVLVSLPIVVSAQENIQVFALPDARAGEAYRVEIEQVLREKYRLKLESEPNAIIQWTVASGEVPSGLTIRSDGTIAGTSREYSERTHNVRLKVVDVSTKSGELFLDFTLRVIPPTLRLVRISAPRLVPDDAVLREPGNNNSDHHPAEANHDSFPSGNDEKAPALIASATSTAAQAVPTNTKSISGQHMRAIIGIEQSGVSSGSSAQAPFIDFFFNAGLSRTHLSAWGDVRLTSTPQQLTAFVSAASNTAAGATGTKINDLATSFDFKLGPEYLLNRTSDSKIKTSLIAGFGATSTLIAPSQTGQIFKLPGQTSPQYASFIEQYPEAKNPGVAFIAFVPLERDRFFRQYFMGLRIRSFHQEDFPSMLDVTFGQNSAVTGGQLRHFVLGIDGSHRLSLMNNAFYVFGSVNLKVGGPKFASKPFILDPADSTVKLSDSNVVITSRQFNRDFYRIGFGVDLIGLFSKSSEKK